MKVEFVVTDDFVKSIKKIRKKYKSISEDLELFKEEFCKNPNVGTDLGKGYRKIRMQIKSKGKGKRGGARIITYDLYIKTIEQERGILLVDIYDKSVSENMSEEVYTFITKNFLNNGQ